MGFKGFLRTFLELTNEYPTLAKFYFTRQVLKCNFCLLADSSAQSPSGFPIFPSYGDRFPSQGLWFLPGPQKRSGFFFVKNKAKELRLPGLNKMVVMGLLMCWCLPLHGELVKNHNTQYGCNERCNHHNTRVVVGKEGSPERNQYDKQGKQYGSNSSCVHGFVI